MINLYAIKFLNIRNIMCVMKAVKFIKYMNFITAVSIVIHKCIINDDLVTIT